jgi:polysaccharide deacetylase family protein (PEP-CTERM system associated)
MNINILSVDLEDYYMVSAFDKVIKREDWGLYESRIEANTHHLLDILSKSPRFHAQKKSMIENSTKATFFCLGIVAKQFPKLVRTIHSSGHEIASHGFDHRMIHHMTRKEFREDVRKTKKILEDLVGAKILGYRAPSYSIRRQTLWALEILSEEGYHYDSSIFPIHHDRYGIPNAPTRPFFISVGAGDISSQLKVPRYYDESRGAERFTTTKTNERIKEVPIRPFIADNFFVEFPISTLRVFGLNLPIGGGGYFRLLPLCFTLSAMKCSQRHGFGPLIFYVHPWELDPFQPRISGISPSTRFRHYLNLGRTGVRLVKLLEAMTFSSFEDYLVGNVVKKK